MRHPIIEHVWRNVYGAWVIMGIMGIRQYYYYTKKEACQKYREEAKETIFVNQ